MKKPETARALWSLAQYLFPLIPRPFYGLRHGLLRWLGAKIGSGCHILPSAFISEPWNLTVGDGAAIGESARIYNPFPVTLERLSTVAQRVVISATEKPVIVREQAWIGADVQIASGVEVGFACLVGARSVVNRDVPEKMIAAGNPLRVLKPRPRHPDFNCYYDPELNLSSHRYTRKEYLLRVVWMVMKPLFPFFPHREWRRSLLKLFGAELGKNVCISRKASVYFPWNLKAGDGVVIEAGVLIYNLGVITLGAQTLIKANAHLCAGSHDFTHPSLTLVKPPIAVGPHSLIGENAFIGPGVNLGANTTVMPDSVVVKDTADGMRVSGNPAKPV